MPIKNYVNVVQVRLYLYFVCIFFLFVATQHTCSNNQYYILIDHTVYIFDRYFSKKKTDEFIFV